MAFTFNKVINDTKIGGSLFDEAGAQIVPDIMKKAAAKGVKIHIPTDFVCGDKISADANVIYRTSEQGIDDGYLGLDIGDKTITNYLDVIKRSKTVFWNGPQGVFELDPFKKGSFAVLDALMESTSKGATSVCGGGDTLAMIKSIKGAHERLSHVSTGGGASLELVEGKELPGIMALSDQ
jgi:phosphoglycerate kinase